jgi:hypothetical protein
VDGRRVKRGTTTPVVVLPGCCCCLRLFFLPRLNFLFLFGLVIVDSCGSEFSVLSIAGCGAALFSSGCCSMFSVSVSFSLSSSSSSSQKSK